VGLTVGDGVSQLFVYPARARSSGEFTQAVIHLTDVRAAVKELRGRGVAFEEYDTPETRTENGIARTPGERTAKASRIAGAWFRPCAIGSHTLRTGGSAWGEPSGGVDSEPR
jgi:hypothetical protein